MHNKNFLCGFGPMSALPLLVAREPFVYVRGFRDGLHAYDAEFAARFKLSGLRALPPPVGWPS